MQTWHVLFALEWVFPTVQRKKNLGLLAAALVGHGHCTDIFIKEGADVNCTEEMFDVVSRRIACETGISFDADTRNGWTPLMCPAGKGHLGPVRKLIKAGASPPTLCF